MNQKIEKSYHYHSTAMRCQSHPQILCTHMKQIAYPDCRGCPDNPDTFHQKLYGLKFSVVMPVKDEADLLKYSLPAIFNLNPDEVILVTEANEAVHEVIQDISNCFPEIDCSIFVLKESVPDWRDRHAFARRLGFQIARNDLIFTIDVDKVADPHVTDYFQLVKEDVGLVSFSEVPKGFELRLFVGMLLQKLGYTQSFMGTYVFSKKAWLETEDEDEAKDVFTSEDTHLHESMKKQYTTLFIADTKVILMRPKQAKRYQYLTGVERRRHNHSLLRTIVSSLFTLKPLALVGFLQGEKLLNSKDRWR